MRDGGAIGSPLVLIALGSNIDSRRYLPEAVRQLAGACRVVSVSSAWETEAVGASGAPRFLNAAVRIDTDLDPVQLKFGLLRPIEERLGRVRGADRDAPRTIDLDIAFFGDRVIDDPENGLIVPDPETLLRAHLALPLAELAPGFAHPLDGRALRDIASEFAGDPTARRLGDLDLRLALDPAILRRVSPQPAPPGQPDD